MQSGISLDSSMGNNLGAMAPGQNDIHLDEGGQNLEVEHIPADLALGAIHPH